MSRQILLYNRVQQDACLQDETLSACGMEPYSQREFDGLMGVERSESRAAHRGANDA